ncbi:MAG: hypothetical protein CMM16_00985 [Rhodospirillaceae bacterium]|nr:hypothetical protein [Rhodospirillaceae bacterium]
MLGYFSEAIVPNSGTVLSMMLSCTLSAFHLKKRETDNPQRDDFSAELLDVTNRQRSLMKLFARI